MKRNLKLSTKTTRRNEEMKTNATQQQQQQKCKLYFVMRARHCIHIYCCRVTRRHDGAYTLIWSIASPINCKLISFYGLFDEFDNRVVKHFCRHRRTFVIHGQIFFGSFLIPPQMFEMLNLDIMRLMFSIFFLVQSTFDYKCCWCSLPSHIAFNWTHLRCLIFRFSSRWQIVLTKSYMDACALCEYTKWKMEVKYRPHSVRLVCLFMHSIHNVLCTHLYK